MGAIASCCAATACSCCIGLSCNVCGAVLRIQKSEATRVWYAAIFIVFSLVAWAMNVWAYDMLSWISWHVIANNCPNRAVCDVYSVYRLAFTLALFHLILSVVLIGVKNSKDARAQFQDGWWPIKLPFLLIVSIVCFLIPNQLFDVFAWIAVFGAGIFLLVQLILLIDFAHSWAESWVGKYEDDPENNKVWYWGLLFCTGSMYAFVLGLSIIMFVFFSSNEQWYNPLVIGLNLVVCLGLTVASVHPTVQEFNPRVGLLQASVVSSYCTYLIWSAILSQPGNLSSNGEDTNTAAGWATVIFGAIFTIISVLYASLRAGSSNLVVVSVAEKESLADSEAGKDDDESLGDFDDEKEATNYNFALFHFIFSLGAMYVGMLLTNWAIIDSSTTSVWTDMGWVSVGVKWACCAVAALLYCWTIVAPLVFPERDFGF